MYELYNPAMVELGAANMVDGRGEKGIVSAETVRAQNPDQYREAIGLDTGVEEYWKRADAENEKR